MRKLSLCTLTLCLGFASITHASSVTKLKIKGNSAGGGTSTPEDPCFNGFFSVQASEQVTKDGTTNAETKELMLFFFGSDNCQSLSYSSFVTLPLTIPIANRSTVTIPFDFLVDVTPFDSEVSTQTRLVGSATITATGDFVKTRQTNITQNETTRQVVRSKGNSREASITVAARLDGAQLNFVPGEAGSAEIGTTKNGTIEVTRY
jgi:hypothetical protein